MALFDAQFDSRFVKAIENRAYMLLVIFESLTEDQDVVKICENVGLASFEHVVDEALVVRRSICETKRHHRPDVVTARGDESGFVD